MRGPDSRVALRAGLFSFLAVPVCYILSLIDSLNHHHVALFLLSVAILLGLGFFAHHVVFEGKKRSPYLYLLTVMAFTTVVDFVLALTIDQYISTLGFYLSAGERYLVSAYGSLINWWDCTVHFSIYIYIIGCLANKDWHSAKPVVLYYVGSIMNSLFVFLPGNVTGPFGNDLKASYLLNIPFAIVPLTLLYHAYVYTAGVPAPASPSSSPRRARPPGRSPARATLATAHRHGDGILRTCLLLGCGASVVVILLRVTSAVGSSPSQVAKAWITSEPYLADASTYPRWQSLVHFFYLIPYLVFSSFSLTFSSTPPSWLFDISLLAAGAVAQGEFSMFGLALHWRSPESSRLSPSSLNFQRIVLLNVLFAALPHVIAYYAHIRGAGKKRSE